MPLNIRQVPIIIIIIILLLWLLCSLFANNDDVAGRKMRLKALRIFNVQCMHCVTFYWKLMRQVKE